jgi:hypothetical protein
MTTLTGSGLLALAVVRGFLSPETAWRAAHIDEDFQAERWGAGCGGDGAARGPLARDGGGGDRHRGDARGLARTAHPPAIAPLHLGGADKLNRGASLFANARPSFFRFATRSVSRSWSPPFWEAHLQFTIC